MLKTFKAGAVGAVVAAASLATLGLTGVASGASFQYVALGDSYASGVGAGNYLDSGACKRSANAYPELYASANGATLDFQACSGAKTTDVINNQLGTLSSSTSLVSITIGGNDLGFTDVMQTCVTGSDEQCREAVAQGKMNAQNVLPGYLHNVYSAVKNKAPHAHVVVLGYPHMYQPGGNCLFAPSDTARGYVNQGADVLDQVIKDVASADGVTFADVRSSFSGHEVCSADPWLNGVNLNNLDESFHPNAAGQQNGYLPNLQANAKVFYKSTRPSHS